VCEQWAEAKGFDVKRIDRRLKQDDRIDDDDPRVALSGMDKIAARKLMAKTGFDCIIDAGLGRTARDFNRFRVSVFDRKRSVENHFAGLTDAKPEILLLPGENLPSARAGNPPVRSREDIRRERGGALCCRP